MLKKTTPNKSSYDIPDIRADEPERAMEQFTAGLKRVLAASKPLPKSKRIRSRK